MAIIYNKVERFNPRDPEAPRKWFVILKGIKRIDEKEVAKKLADETTLNNKEAEMALAQFKKVLLDLLLSGYSVQLSDWGSFHLTCNSEACDTKELTRAASIKKLNIRFTPGKEIKEALEKATFVFSESLVTDSNATEETIENPG